jgi:hypothetical protein
MLSTSEVGVNLSTVSSTPLFESNVRDWLWVIPMPMAANATAVKVERTMISFFLESIMGLLGLLFKLGK